MQKLNFETFINGVGNDLKTTIDDLIGVISSIYIDVEQLKVKTSKPDKETAKELLEYLGMENSKSKKNLEDLCKEEMKQYMKWLDFYCQEQGCTQVQALNKIIDGEI